MRAVAYAEDFDADLGETLAGEAKLVGDGLGHIEHAASNEGAPVIHTDFGGFSILEIGHSNEAGKRQRFVGSTAGPGPELFADGRFAGEDQEMLAVVRGDSCFDMADRLAGMQRMIANATQGVGLVFVAVIGRRASAEEDRNEEKQSERGFGHGVSIWMAARRDAGMRPQ